MWWLIAIAAGAFGLFELNKHRATAAQQAATQTSLVPGRAYAIVVKPSDPSTNPLFLLRALTDPKVGAWGSLGSPFVTTGAMPSPGADGTTLVPVLYLNPLAFGDLRPPIVLHTHPVTDDATGAVVANMGDVTLVGAIAL